ncbi:MAG: triose-phosphate isomerase [Saprospiraceae bacterium]|nr:triose-phosphate isomerase [Saprospiraceae bacterium]
MGRKKIVAGNWKMNLNLDESLALAKHLSVGFDLDHPMMVVIPPFIHALAVKDHLGSVQSPIKIGVQNCHQELKGAYTGEISAPMIKSNNIPFVILGHSERRQFFHETDELLAKKVSVALNQGLTPIFCVGEPLEIRNQNSQNDFVGNQLQIGLFHLDAADFEKVVIAYEPIWAIGSGVTASPAQAQEMHAYIRACILSQFDQSVADNTTILYGGSVKGSNATDLFANPDVDGALVGGASLDAVDFIKIAYSLV